MFNFLVNAEGGLTTAGYAVSIIAGVLLFVLALVFAGKTSEKKKMSTKQLVFCAMAMALAFVTSYVKVFSLPLGRKRNTLQYAVHCAGCKLVWCENRCLSRACLWNFAVYPRAFCTFLFPSLLRLYSCICSTWSGRIICKEVPRFN